MDCPKGGEHEWGTDGQHSNKFCKKCFVDFYPDCPECEKMLAVTDDSHKLGEFLDWLREDQHIELCKLNDYDLSDKPQRSEYFPVRFPLEQLLAYYFKIDLKKVEQERRAILAQLRT